EARKIGERIVRLRMTYHLTQLAAAQRIGIGYRTYQSWEAGDATPRWHNFERIAKAYGVTVDEILGNPPDRAPTGVEARVEYRLDAIEQQLKDQADLLEALRSSV